ncbi:MAG: 5-oxoprolinase subunit PxpB [Acidobacteria bacterium]|nr:5-oxoprolinase subunit PxpB [Acidobacteriota bacterium]
MRQAGDRLWLIELGTTIDPELNAQAIALADRVRQRRIDGVRDVAPAYASVGVHFDPLRTDLARLERAIREAAAEAHTTPSEAGALHEIPVRYGGVDGPDLAAVAARAGCEPDEVIRLHTSRDYRVYMLGFVPGFAYLGRVDERIATPRHAVPRTRVPAGSVGIAGVQTGVYPMETPGGWQLIGRTDVRFFDAQRTPAVLVRAGDRVRFVAA